MAHFMLGLTVGGVAMAALCVLYLWVFRKDRL
jgi:hypothetical protein